MSLQNQILNQKMHAIFILMGWSDLEINVFTYNFKEINY